MKRFYCFLQKFNNYFNRKIIKYESLDDYISNSDDYFIPVDSNGAALPFDFNPNDNITTEIIANSVPFEPDYFLLLDDEQNIIQRWFCIEQKRNRQGQWLYQLKRDVISDNLNSLLRAPIFVQKGMLNEDDPFIFNDEGMSFNEIKKDEILIKDKTGIAWIVGYIAKNKGGSDINIQIPQGEITGSKTMSQIAASIGITEAQLVAIINGSGESVKGDINIKTFVNYVDNTNNELECISECSNDLTSIIESRGRFSTILNQSVRDIMFAKMNFSFTSTSGLAAAIASIQSPLFISSGFLASLKSGWSSHSGGNVFISESMFSKIIDVVNAKTPILYNSKYYYLDVNVSSTANKKFLVNQTTYVNLKTALDDTVINFNSLGGEDKLTRDNVGGVEVNYTVQTFTLSLQEIPDDSGDIPQASTKISSSRATVEDQTFDMFAIPFSDIYFSKGTYFNASGDICRKIAIEIAKELDDECYDLQLLPYFPEQDLITYYGPLGYIINIASKTEDIDFNYIDMTIGGTPKHVGVILWCKSSSFSFQMPSNWTDIYKGTNMYVPKSSSFSKKVKILCDKHRLISPNYQGAFEFNLQRDGGDYDYYDIDCTYKPFTPYIRVAPQFNLFYGTNFRDCRGLICGGDYSLPRVSDKWYNFQLNNKNYQNIFNREIQNLDIRQSLEMRNQLVSGAASIFGDTAKGAAAGAMVGAGWGALAGGVIGGAASGVGYGIDVDTLARMQRETKQLAIDKFNYQLGNVKALPYTISKLGTWNVNSKIFPFLEYYTCTDEEKEALENKIKYESMTVMRIGTLEEFSSSSSELSYFKGVLIRNDEIADDTHILNNIYEELLKGVYI